MDNNDDHPEPDFEALDDELVSRDAGLSIIGGDEVSGERHEGRTTLDHWQWAIDQRDRRRRERDGE